MDEIFEPLYFRGESDSKTIQENVNFISLLDYWYYVPFNDECM